MVFLATSICRGTTINYIIKTDNYCVTAARFEPRNHLARKQTLNHLARLASVAKWLSVRLRAIWLWFKSRYCPLNFRYRASFEQGVP